MDNQTRQYVNTMVFAIIAGIVSLILLVLIFYASDLVNEYNPLIITIEVGLILIVAIAIYRIIANERAALKRSKNGVLNRLTVNTCPDYWVKTKGTQCINSFFSPTTPHVQYYITGSPPLATSDASKDSQTIDLADYTDKKVSEVCAQFTTTLKAPWTDVKAVCDSYRIL
jgi:hypothetical protein